ncbi:hypothetical protein CHS0354_032728 [Potamilus streckersoni]|uniref:Ig-like domain-containing protein n=1 Tax=Potamilus streckersoni TaxID=2493646 RepID=A0AAE0VW30_9BIVA|nr:hypothetical protein CHS0354_032728 [Potamilus streckersoni]
MQLDPYPARDSLITVWKDYMIIMRVKGTESRDVADRFEFTGNTIENRITFVLRNVTLGDAGIYTATESGFPPGGEQTLIVKVTSPVQVIVGWNASFRMQLDPYPSNDSLITVWKDGMIIMRVKGAQSRDVADRFEFTGNTIENRISFVLRNVTLGDAGIYTATESGIPPGGEQTLIVKASPSKPQIITITSSVLGSDYRLNCSSVSNSAPPDHGLTIKSEWKVNDQLITTGISYKVQGTELTITSLSRQDNGVKLTCVAYEDSLAKSVPSNEHVIDVKYGPENVQLSPSVDIIKAIENHPVIIQCTADCNPTCSFQWRRGSVPGYLKPNQTLMIDSVGKSDTDNYTCTVSNSITGRSQSLQTTLVVIYEAKIVSLSLLDSNTVNENSSAIFQCQVDSNPLPTITWKKEGTDTVLKIESGVVQSQFRIESAQCQDTDNYTCSAYNGIRTQANGTLQFFVKCHPRSDSEVLLETKVYKKLYEAAFLRYEVISYPFPKFTWMFLGNGSESRDLPDSASLHVNGQQSELRFTSLNINDFGYYSVMADNSLLPSAREVFEIKLAEPPSPVIRDFQVGAVAGGVVGGIVLVIAFVAVAFIVKRRIILRPKVEVPWQQRRRVHQYCLQT